VNLDLKHCEEAKKKLLLYVLCANRGPFQTQNSAINQCRERFVCLVGKDLRIRAGGDPASAEKEKIQVKDLLTGWYLP
jgi:hypothetical protein